MADSAEQDHPALSLGRDDVERLEKLADIIGGVHKSCADPELHEDDARFLRDLAKRLGDGGQGEAAAEIDRLYKEREEARAGEDEFKAERDAALAALQPFAALAEEVDRLRHSDDSTCPHRLRAGDIRRAASVAECRACGGPPHESWCAASLSTQPVPSYLSEEGVREKLLGELEERATESYRGSRHPAPESIEEGEAEGQGDAYTHAAELVRASLSASSDTGGAGADRLPAQKKTGGGLTRFGLYVASLRWAIGFIDKRHKFGEERPVNGGDAEDDWMEHAAALDLLKDAAATSTQLSVSPDPEEDCERCEGIGSLGFGVKPGGPQGFDGVLTSEHCPDCNGTGKKPPRDTGEEPGREGEPSEVDCPNCDGGLIDGVEPECCGNTTSSGECRGDCAVPRQNQEECPTCGGTGREGEEHRVDNDGLAPESFSLSEEQWEAIEDEARPPPPIEIDQEWVDEQSRKYIRVIWREIDGEKRRATTFVPIDRGALGPDFLAALDVAMPKRTAYLYDEAERMVKSSQPAVPVPSGASGDWPEEIFLVRNKDDGQPCLLNPRQQSWTPLPTEYDETRRYLPAPEHRPSSGGEG